MPELIFFRRSVELMRVALDGRRVTVGRAGANDILVPDPSVSRQQFALEQEGPDWLLRDLSGRGTEVAGSLAQERALEDGTDIGLGQWRAIFSLSSAGFTDEATRGASGGDTRVLATAASETRTVPVRLIVRAGGQERTVPLGRQVTIGSAQSCEVRIEDPFVSSTHARIERRDHGLAVVDLQSRNGTFIGSVRIFEAEVPVGTTLRIGEAEVVLARADRDPPLSLFEGMVGSTPAMRKVFDTIERVADSNAAVSIFGESGTGKELVARAVHARSSRASKPFVPINCGALSKELVESELFGHEKGAFTGAERLRRGAFEEADTGTLFLDEIGELPLGLQAKLLRALELGEIKRVGATRPITTDVRVVAATNRDLRAEVKRGAFREDLYWRLCVIPLQLPPLRARRGDVRSLLQYFLKLYSPQGAAVMLTADAERKLLDYDWPGNVRELKNTIHRSLLLRRGEAIEAADILFDRDLNLGGDRASEADSAYDPFADDTTCVYIVGKPLERIEDEVFIKTCRRLGTRASVVARALGQSRGAAYRRMEKLGITPGGEPPEESLRRASGSEAEPEEE
ncbi:MAG: sigma 54-interacting transcriptional regulator [Myxococcales bacterium]|jgi:two-component system response regulator HydG